MSKRAISNALLLVAAFIWGTTFVAQSVGMDFIGPFTFNGVRSAIGGLTLLPVMAVMRRARGPLSAQVKRHTLAGGLWCGVVLFAASSLQQFGMVHTTAGKAGFITALYIVLVPLAGLFLNKRVKPLGWFAVGLAAAGLYLLCFADTGERLSIGLGDLLVLGCAFLFTAHILVIDHLSASVDGVLLSCVQFSVAGVLSFVGMALFETPSMTNILDCWAPILYAGVLSSGVAFTLQIIAQKNTSPTVASLLMSLEAVFGALAGWVVLGERFTAMEFTGVALMFAAIILAQLPGRRGASAS